TLPSLSIAASPVRVSLTVNNQSGELLLPKTSTFTLRWSSSNATSCTASTFSVNGSTSPWLIAPNDSGIYVGNFGVNSLSYTISCKGAGGSTDTKTVKILNLYANRYVSFVVAYSTAETTILAAGVYYLTANHTIYGTSYFEDARYTQIVPSAKLHNAMNVPLGFGDPYCRPGSILLPYFMGTATSITGTWRESGSTLQVILGAGATSHVWKVENSSKGSLILIDVPGYQNVHGYAFISSENPLSLVPLRDVQLMRSYPGSIQQNATNNPLAQYVTYVLSPSLDWFSLSAQSDPDVRGRTYYVNDGASIYAQKSVARNVPGYSSNMIFEAFGHDFDNNGCYNLADYGHTRLNWGIFEKGKITKMLILESSWQSGAMPIISVGRSFGSN
ncbi:MAG: hypothetical protein AB7P49_05355, partial [Bdellovibrionales bacterium]